MRLESVSVVMYYFLQVY